MIRLLIISNMFPSKQKPYSGIFVKNQYLILKNKNSLKVSLFAMKRTFTSKLGSVLKYFKSFFNFIPNFFKKYDVIHVHFFYPLIILAYLYKVFYSKTKIFVTFHGSDINKYMNNAFDKKVFKFLLTRVDFVISVGKDLGDTIQKKMDRSVDLVLNAGVDSSIFYNLNLPNKKYDFIFVGSFIHRKGVDILLDSIKLIGNKSISYCFVGSGPYLKEIEDLSKDFNVVVYKNQNQVQLRKLYNESRFFILPSRDEPFGLVASEAVFCGTPCIVSSNGGLKEQIVNKINGFVVNSDSPIAYSNIINKCYSMESKEYLILTNNCTNVSSEFDINFVCNKLENLYLSV